MNDKPSRTAGATGKWWKGLYHTMRSRLLHKTKFRTIVYCYDPSAETRTENQGISDLEFGRFCNMAEAPDDLFETLDPHERRKLTENFRDLFSGGGTLYLAAADNEIASYIWSIRRCALPDWHAEISGDAVILYAAGTRQKFRGRGLHRVMMRHSIAAESESGASIYADAAEWNAVTRRNIEACGFRQIGVNERPLKT